MKNRHAGHALIMMWLCAVLLAMTGCGEADSTVTATAPADAGGEATCAYAPTGADLTPWSRDADLARVLARPRARLGWPDRTLTLAGAAEPAARRLAVDRLQERSLTYVYDPVRRRGEVGFAVAADLAVRIVEPGDGTAAATDPILLVDRSGGTERYAWAEAPAVLLRQIREYCRPFATWTQDEAAAAGLLEGDRDLGDWRPFISWYCGFTRKLYLLTNGFPQYEPTLALCDLVFTLMDWEWEDIPY